MSNLRQNFEETDLFYTPDDHKMWQDLYERQSKIMIDRANPVFLRNLKRFDLPKKTIPSISTINEKLFAANGWLAEPVDGMVGYEAYFTLLKQRKFPVATSIRIKSEEDLSKDPDFFHEIFGHCTMLFSKDYADFMSEYARYALTVPKPDRPLFARLIWFTTETALINIAGKLKIYGSSVLSSYKESLYCLEDADVIYKPFDVVSIFREPYRADILQKVYYVLKNEQQVYNLLSDTSKLFDQIKIARTMGELPALFTVTKSKYSNIGHCVPTEELMTI